MPLDPRDKVAFRLLAELHALTLRLEHLVQLPHRPVRLPFRRVIVEHKAAVFRQIGKDRPILLPRALRLLEKVHVVHADERPLRHHRHRVHGLAQRLRRERLGAEAVEVEFRRRPVQQLLLQHPPVVLLQKRLFPEEHVEIAYVPGLQRRLQPLQCRRAVLSPGLSRHSLTSRRSGFPAHRCGTPPRRTSRSFPMSPLPDGRTGSPRQPKGTRSPAA